MNVMYDTVSRAMTHGVMGSTPWCKLDKVKFLCPVPGYDRHFAITEYFGIEMINVPMTPERSGYGYGRELVCQQLILPSKESGVCRSIPTRRDITYSDETVRRFARLEPAAPDFRIYWDNAYGIHHLYDDDQDHLIEILAEPAREPEIRTWFTSSASTSKISFPGSGVAAIATSQRQPRRHQGSS